MPLGAKKRILLFKAKSSCPHIPKEFIPVWLHVRLVSTLQLYSHLKANGSGQRAELIAKKSSMAAVMAAVIYVHQPGEGREYTADSAGSIWRQYISTELSGTTKCSTVQCCRATKEECRILSVFCDSVKSSV